MGGLPGGHRRRGGPNHGLSLVDELLTRLIAWAVGERVSGWCGRAVLKGVLKGDVKGDLKGALKGDLCLCLCLALGLRLGLA